MSKKFKLREDLSIYFFGHELFRIECVEEIESKNIKVGQLGGYVEKEDNLYGDARVSGNAVTVNFPRMIGEKIKPVDKIKKYSNN